ncbi:MAG: hypothetical protein IPO67_05260 [Deltaproteobacteria bacterium]|nr:hypothetical protein [Deltaproteobacteria bacterium]
MSRQRSLCLMVAVWLLGACVGEDPNKTPLPELPPVVNTVVAPRPPGPIVPARRVTLVLTGEVRGELEPCGCPTLPFGGFPRRERLLSALQDEGAPLVQLDAGDALLRGLATSKAGEREERGALILKLMGAVGVDVMAPGASDLQAVGLAGLKEAEAAGLRLSSATWLSEATGAPVFPAAVVVEREGLKVGVVGLSAPPREGAGVVAAPDTVAAARAAVASLPEGLDLIVALGNLPEVEARRVLEEVPGLSMGLFTQGDSFDEPRQLGGVAWVEVAPRGRYVSVARVRLGSTAGQGVEAEAEPGWAALVGLLVRRERLEAGEARDQLDAKIAALEAELGAKAAGRNLAAVESRPLGSDLDGPATVSAAIDTYKGVRVSQAKAQVQEAPPHSAGYATSGECVRCHSLQFARWTYTPHAKAVSSLSRRGEQQNPECVGCHTTGYAEPGGFAETTPSALRTWGGVQCEACHGPLKGHPRVAEAAPQPVTEATCLGCHDAANSPNFDYTSYLRQVICPADPKPGDGVEEGAVEP